MRLTPYSFVTWVIWTSQVLGLRHRITHILLPSLLNRWLYFYSCILSAPCLSCNEESTCSNISVYTDQLRGKLCLKILCPENTLSVQEGKVALDLDSSLHLGRKKTSLSCDEIRKAHQLGKKCKTFLFSESRGEEKKKRHMCTVPIPELFRPFLFTLYFSTFSPTNMTNFS